MAPSVDVKIKQYETTVVEYLNKEGGHLLVATNDTSFVGVLKATVIKQLALDADHISTIIDENTILKAVTKLSAAKKSLVVFIERVLNNKETSFLVQQIKSAYNNVKIIILTSEAEKQRLVLLHEIGADNFISKPISINNLIEKIAFTIKPQGKIGKLIEVGKQFNTRDDFENALKISRQILEIKPNSAGALLVQGDAYKGLAKVDKAVEAYELACEYAPMYLEPLKKLAQLFGEQGELEKQLAYLEKLDKLSPLNVERKVDMGGVHVELGNDDKAEDLFSGAVRQARREALSFIEDITTKIAGIYTNKDPAKAEVYYRQALESKGDMLDESDIKTFNQLGIALRKQGKWEKAIIEYKKAQKISPTDENLHYNIALAFAEGKDFTEALRHMEQALELNPEFFVRDAVVAHNLGLIFSKNGKTSVARQFLQQALKVDPDFQSSQRLLEQLGGA
ncbi:MAG: response regulator [Desulfovibrio sp.]|nr:MAG: response regulator [Desulfovibrio sp.]